MNPSSDLGFKPDTASAPGAGGDLGFTPDKAQSDPLNEGFLDSFAHGIVGMFKGLTSGVVNDLRPKSSAEKQAAIDQAVSTAEKAINGNPDEKEQARNTLISAVPLGSTFLKASRRNFGGAAGDLAAMGTMGVATGAALNSDTVAAAPGALKAGLKAGAGDIAAGAAKIGAGEAAGAIPGMEWPGRIAFGYPGMRQMAEGIKNFWTTGKQVLSNAGQSKQPPNVMSEADWLASSPPEAGSPQPQAPGRAPLWQGKTGATPTGAPEFSSTPATALPSGRIPGSPQPQAHPTPLIDRLSNAVASAPPLEDPQLLDGLSRSLAKKPFKSLSPDQQRTVRTVAIRISNGQQAAPQAAAPPLEVRPSLSQVESDMAQTPPAPAENPRSSFTASGDQKSPQMRAQEILNSNIDAKAQRFAQALHDAGITSVEAVKIPMGQIATDQIAKGATPGWGNITDALVQRGFLQKGELPPNLSLFPLVKYLKQFEAADTAAPQK